MPLIVTQNGAYSTPMKMITESWGDDSEYDFLQSDGYPYNVKKAEKLIIPSDIDSNTPTGTMTAILATGEQVQMSLEELGFTYDADYGYAYPTYCPAVMWVVDATFLNEVFGVNYFENNTVYVTNAYKEVNRFITGVSFTTFGAEPADGYCPVVVDIQPKLGFRHITLTENGTTEILPYDGEDGLSKVTVNVSCDMQKELIPVLDGSVTELYCTNLKMIRPYAFRGCEKLEKATLRITSASIEDYTFANCSKLTTVNRYNSGNILPNEIYVPYRIGASAFSNTGLSRSLKITASQVVMNAFYNCDALTSVDIFLHGNYSPKYVQTGAFEHCNALETVRITCDDTRTDEYRAYIWFEAFENCSNLKSLTLNYPMVMKVMETNTNYLPESLNAIYVPADVVDAYKADAVWGLIANKIYPIPTEVA